MKESYVITGVIIGTILIIGGAAFVSGRADKTAQIEQTTDAKATVLATTHSWDDIPINDGDVEATFAITNDGSSPLQLFNVTTSCTCTTAQLTVGDKKSPEFAMHTASDYVTEVSAGEAAQLRVIFDPAFHGPQGTGPITRQVRVQTNDAAQPMLEFSLEGTVI